MRRALAGSLFTLILASCAPFTSVPPSPTGTSLPARDATPRASAKSATPLPLISVDSAWRPRAWRDFTPDIGGNAYLLSASEMPSDFYFQSQSLFYDAVDVTYAGEELAELRRRGFLVQLRRHFSGTGPDAPASTTLTVTLYRAPLGATAGLRDVYARALAERGAQALHVPDRLGADDIEAVTYERYEDPELTLHFRVDSAVASVTVRGTRENAVPLLAVASEIGRREVFKLRAALR